ncbi:MAG TPA: peptidoglycan-binding domain-containing protein [Bacillales bacterium]|nr:peptidoglycan-binding domain-containing protein [Bacillales bacterium]
MAIRGSNPTGTASQHYAGKSFDGVPYYRTLSALHNVAEEAYQNTIVVNYVEPLSQSVNHVHWDNRANKGIGGYPAISKYDLGVYVITMQHCLEHLRHIGRFKSTAYNYEYGVYDSDTIQLVKDYQRNAGLDVDGICGQNTWNRLNSDAYHSGQ